MVAAWTKYCPAGTTLSATTNSNGTWATILVLLWNCAAAMPESTTSVTTTDQFARFIKPPRASELSGEVIASCYRGGTNAFQTECVLLNWCHLSGPSRVD